MSEEKQFANGIWFNKPHQNAPDFVIGKLSISVQNFIAWLNEHDENDKVRIDIKESRAGKVYCELDTYQGQTASVANTENDNEEAPF